MQFLGTQLVILGGLFAAACGADRSDPTTPTGVGSETSQLQGSNCPIGAAVVQTDNVHPHQTVQVPAAAIAAGASGSFTLLTGAHQHTYVVSAQDFLDLKDGQQVTKPMDQQGHGHSVTLTC